MQESGRLGVDPPDAASERVGHPHCAGANRERCKAVGGDLDPPGHTVGCGVDPGHGRLAVDNPHAAVSGGDVQRLDSPDRRHDVVGPGIDPGDGQVGIDGPHRSGRDGDVLLDDRVTLQVWPAPPGKRDRLGDETRSRVDAGDALRDEGTVDAWLAKAIANPDRTRSDGKVGGG